MKYNLVITGATGFVGSNLTKYFLNLNYDVNLIVRPNSDLSHLIVISKNLKIFRYDNDLNSLISFFKSTNPICTFHLASNFIAEHNSYKEIVKNGYESIPSIIENIDNCYVVWFRALNEITGKSIYDIYKTSEMRKYWKKWALYNGY
jgi:nucleoside-diphosphate-sugar epimerase